MTKHKQNNALNPLPSLVRASAWDAGNRHMRTAGRTKWSQEDYDESARVQERLIRSCYGRPNDMDNPDIVYIRFQIAEQLERAGHFNLCSDVTKVNDYIDQALAA